MEYLAVFGGIGLFALVLTVVALRIRRSDDAGSLALRAARIQAECHPHLVAPTFFWSVWQDTDKATMTILVRDERDAAVAAVAVPSVPLGGVLRRFEYQGRQYEIHKPGLMSKRTCLREAGRATVLASADHDTLRTTYFRGDGEQVLFVLPVTSVLRSWRPCRVDGQEVGKLIVELARNKSVRVLTLPPGVCSPLEQVFVLANT